MDDLDQALFQKITVQLKEGESMDWENPEDPVTKQVLGFGLILYKHKCKGGWVCFVKAHSMDIVVDSYKRMEQKAKDEAVQSQ